MAAPKRKKRTTRRKEDASAPAVQRRTSHPFAIAKLPRQRAFLMAYVETGGNVKLSAECAGVSRYMHYEWLHEEGEKGDRYREAFERAKELRNEALEDEATRRAHEGLRKYKFKRDGTPILHPVTGEPYYEHEYSDLLLVFRMKGAMPERYRERHEHTGQVGGNPVNVNIQNNVRTVRAIVAEMSDEQLRALQEVKRIAASGQIEEGSNT